MLCTSFLFRNLPRTKTKYVYKENYGHGHHHVVGIGNQWATLTGTTGHHTAADITVHQWAPAGRGNHRAPLGTHTNHQASLLGTWHHSSLLGTSPMFSGSQLGFLVLSSDTWYPLTFGAWWCPLVSSYAR